MERKDIINKIEKNLYDTSKDEFVYEHIDNIEELRKMIKQEEGQCIQQVCYSTYHDALTQINFTRKIIRTNIKLNSEKADE